MDIQSLLQQAYLHGYSKRVSAGLITWIFKASFSRPESMDIQSKLQQA
jgi:hypothetical protein